MKIHLNVSGATNGPMPDLIRHPGVVGNPPQSPFAKGGDERRRLDTARFQRGFRRYGNKSIFGVIMHYAGFIKNQSGFSLAEALVAVAILGVSASAFITALSTGAISVRIQDELALAQGLAQSQMEVVKAAPYNISGNYPILSTPSGYSITLLADSSVYGDNRIQQITVTVLHENSAVLSLANYKVNR